MKKISILLALMSIVVVSIAQTSSDAEAKKILDEVSAKFKSYKTAQVNFIYKVENGAGNALSARTGKVSMKGAKYHVSFDDQEIFCDGYLVWTYDKNANEVIISKLDASGTAITPQKLFTNFYDKDFYYKFNGIKKEAGKLMQEIEMTPKDKSRPFHKIYVLIDKASKSIYSTRILENSGIRYSYTFSNLKSNAVIADALFAFDEKKYPGVEVIDLRD